MGAIAITTDANRQPKDSSQTKSEQLREGAHKADLNATQPY